MSLLVKIGCILLLSACQQGAMKGGTTEGHYLGDAVVESPFEFKSFNRLIFVLGGPEQPTLANTKPDSEDAAGQSNALLTQPNPQITQNNPPVDATAEVANRTSAKETEGIAASSVVGVIGADARALSSFDYNSYYRTIDQSTIQASLISPPTAEEMLLAFESPLRNSVRSSGNLLFCDKIHKTVPYISYGLCLGTKMQPSSAQSVNGEPIFYADFSQREEGRSKTKVLLLGGIHGDELTSVSSVFHWTSELANKGNGSVDWRIVPLVNPDGFFNAIPTRTNANGVDLNRNLPTPNWHSLALDYWRKFAKQSERKFPGHSPASEPESQWLIREIEFFQPDLIITVHAPYNLVDYDALDRSMAPVNLGILAGKQLGTFPGSLGRYAGEQRNIPVITIELPHSVEMPTKLQIDGIFTDLLEWLKKHILSKDSI